MKGIFFAALVALAVTAATAADDATSIEKLFKVPQYRSMRISPDGKRIAAIAPVAGRQNLVVLDIDTRKANAVTSLTDSDVLAVQWINNKRLLFFVGSIETSQFDTREGVLMAADADGADFVDLQAVRDLTFGYHRQYTSLVRTLPGDGDEVIAQDLLPPHSRDESWKPGELVRLDTRTGRRTPIGGAKPDSGEGERWIVDSRGVPRALVVSEKGMERIYYHAGAETPWRKLDEGKALWMEWTPLAVADDDRSLVVASRKGRDTAAIVLYDPEKRAFGDVLAAHPQVDLTDLRRERDGRIVGVSYEADRGGHAWFDRDLAVVQKAIDGALPDTVNDISWSTDKKRFIVHAYSDVSPGSFYLFDLEKKRLEWIADGAPWIEAKKMSHMKAVRYAARDGLEIPAYLTVPRGSDGRDLPMVVIVHGGPWVEGNEWRFDPEVQFLAARGYAVLQPNFRGTRHYGWKLFHSSFGQWGLAMQDDIADGVLWAVKQGIADPKRVCIYGGSYGGYAAMMGLARNPELYKCGVNYVGVTDLPLFLTMTWADYAGTDFQQYDAKELVGDVDRDAARLKATSPVNLAARIEAPVLMAYGSDDRRVPIEHGTRMRAALLDARKPVEWLVAEGEGHGFRDPKNQAMFYGAMEKFLERNIGSGAARN